MKWSFFSAGPYKLHTVYATPYPGPFFLSVAHALSQHKADMTPIVRYRIYDMCGRWVVEREPDAGVQTKAASPHARGTRHEARSEVTSLAPATTPASPSYLARPSVPRACLVLLSPAASRWSLRAACARHKNDERGQRYKGSQGTHCRGRTARRGARWVCSSGG